MRARSSVASNAMSLPPLPMSAPAVPAEPPSPVSPKPGASALPRTSSQPDLVSPLADVGAVWAPHRTQSELEAAERVVQDGLVAASQRQEERDGGATLLCAPGFRLVAARGGPRRPRARLPSLCADPPRRSHELLDCRETLNAAAAAIVDDTFTKCFKSNAPDPWNWNVYLFPLWVCGVVVRYGLLFPIRCAPPLPFPPCAPALTPLPSLRSLLSLLAGFIVFFIAFLPIHFLLPTQARRQCERHLIEFLAFSFVFSWTGVVRYHGARPSLRTNQVFVANHTSMIDFIILEQCTPFAVIMQKHGGWVGWLQGTVLSSLGCIHFNRAEAADRANVANRIRAHAATPGANPLLIFPEGTCVNNEFVCMFKKGVFELDLTVCPIAIKYNKIFVDAFWNSRREGFTRHLTRIMTSWALVADVWYMEPMSREAGETGESFAERVREAIAERAGLKCVPWDGMLKYYRPSAGMCARQRQAFASRMQKHLDGVATPKQKARGGEDMEYTHGRWGETVTCLRTSVSI